jgi:alpha-ketoglutarate-dependent taurine dioxygenase
MPLAPLFDQPHHPLLMTPDGDPSPGALAARLAGPDGWQRLLHRHGAILLRGYALDSADDFQAMVAQLGGETYGYVGGNSPRTRIVDDVYTATDYPATEVISLHNELSYMRAWPRRLFFFSALPAMRGGQTSLAHAGDILRAMPAEIVAELRARRLNYVRYFHPHQKLGKSWQTTYQTDDREALSAILREHGSVAEWRPNGTLRVSTACEAFTVHPVTGEEVWFNQAEQWHPSALHPQLRQMLESAGQLVHHCEFGDGGVMHDAMLAEIRHVIKRHKLLFDWQTGDLLMLDNVLLMHGRESFTGSRKTFAYLSHT